MMSTWSVGVFALLCVSSVWTRPPSEQGFRGFRIVRLSADDVQSLLYIIEELSGRYDLDFWTRAAKYADVMVEPAVLDDVVRAAENAGLTTSVGVNDVQELLDKDFQDRQRAFRVQGPPNVAKEFLDYDEINDYLKRVMTTATAADVTMDTMGQSYEGRDVNYVTIREKATGERQKYNIVIDAGIHAREWMSVSMALNIIEKLAFNPDNDPEVAELLSKFNWVVAPVVNPDGYAYSHKGSNERLWRKNRSTDYRHLSSPGCNGIGVDLNRNFGYHWDPAAGGSSDPCSTVYSGPEAFSEPETRNVRDWLTSMRAKTRLYLNLHAYGEWVLYPYGADPDMPREEEELMIGAGEAFLQAANEHGRDFGVGNSADVYYIAAGGADDFAKGELGISLSYTPELSPNMDDPEYAWYGFVLPKSAISTLTNSTWPGFKAMAKYVFDLYGFPAQTEN